MPTDNLLSDIVAPETREEEYELVYKKPSTLVDVALHYCPGCAHSLVHKLLMEVIEEMGMQLEELRRPCKMP